MDSHLETFMTSLCKMKDNDVMTDVTLKLPDDSTIACHKLVLVAASSFFESMFKSGLKESIEHYVKLEFTDADTMRILVEFIYSGKIDVNEENVQTLVAACEFLFLDDLKTHCEDFMTTLIRSSNHRELYDFGKKFNLKKLISSAYEFYLSHFKEVVEMSAFETLTEAELVEVVSDDRLNTENEDIVFDSVVRWVNSDPGLRKEAFPRIAPHIRFPFCTQETLSRVVSCEPLMWNPECFQLITEAQHSQFHSGENHVENARTTPRNNKSEFLVRMYNDKSGSVCFEYTASIEEEAVIWEVNSLDFNIKLSKGEVLVSLSGNLWIISDDCRMSVDLKSKKITAYPWKKTSINDGCTFLIRDDFVWAVSGTKFEYIDPRGVVLGWKHYSQLLKGVTHAHVIHLPNQFSETIFILGGFLAQAYNQTCRLTQKIDLESKSCTMCCSMPGECTYGQAVALNGQIYLVGGKERVCFRYDPVKDTWTVLARPPIPSTLCSATVWKGKIILNAKKDSTGQVYDPDVDRWSLKDNLFNKETKRNETKLLCTMRF